MYSFLFNFSVAGYAVIVDRVRQVLDCPPVGITIFQCAIHATSKETRDSAVQFVEERIELPLIEKWSNAQNASSLCTGLVMPMRTRLLTL